MSEGSVPQITVFKQSAIAKPSREVMTLATRVERARQRHNERVAKADSDYIEEIRTAVAAVAGHAMVADAPNPQEEATTTNN